MGKWIRESPYSLAREERLPYLLYYLARQWAQCNVISDVISLPPPSVWGNESHIPKLHPKNTVISKWTCHWYLMPRYLYCSRKPSCCSRSISFKWVAVMEVRRIWDSTEIGHGVCIWAYFFLMVNETACKQSWKGQELMTDLQRVPKLHEHIFQIKLKITLF